MALSLFHIYKYIIVILLLWVIITYFELNNIQIALKYMKWKKKIFFIYIIAYIHYYFWFWHSLYDTLWLPHKSHEK